MRQIVRKAIENGEPVNLFVTAVVRKKNFAGVVLVDL